MITSHKTQVEISGSASLPLVRKVPRPSQYWSRFRSIHAVAWLCLALACLGSGWFAYQCVLEPQPERFTPEWGNAQWVQAAGGTAPVAYFRYAFSLENLPDSAFVTIAASQVFKLYVNGSYIGSNYTDFVQGIFPRTYMYDISSPLRSGVNAIGIRVANADEQDPGVRVNVGILVGNALYSIGSGSNWAATFQSENVYPRYAASPLSWATATFDATSWSPARKMAVEPASPDVTVNPQLYERPVAVQWVSAGLGHDAYFVSRFSLPFGITGAWLRLVATGIANVYINGHLLIVWNGQVQIPEQNLADYLGDNATTVEYRSGLMLGMYDIGSYLQLGANTIAIHVLSPGVSAAQVGLGNLAAALSTDVLFSNFMGHSSWLTTADGWHASDKPSPGWEDGDNVALNWPSPILVGRPGAVRTLYLPDSVSPRNQQPVPLLLSLLVIFVSMVGVLAIWLGVSLFAVKKYFRSRLDALETMGMAFLPALALEGVLVALSREPQMPQPFPYTWLWAAVLVGVVGVSTLLLCLNARTAYCQRGTAVAAPGSANASPAGIGPLRDGLLKLYHRSPSPASPHHDLSSPWLRLWAWLRTHWVLLLVMALAVPMVCYGINYEPYWQDELSSYIAAQGILAHGMPFFLSGYLYTKAELYSYVLALWIHFWGAAQGLPRLISIIEYLFSIPLLYRVGWYFFNRRVALVATVMLAFSPVVLIWARQMRMYEQAQLLTLLTVYLFYRALEERQKIYLIYLAAGSLALDYLSHEEIFVILPALLLCVLLASRDSKHRLPSVFYQKHWWIAATLCASVILLQLLSVRFTSPPNLGTDSSQRPFVGFTTDNVRFYVDYLFFPQALGGAYPFLAVNSVLAALGCIWARRATDKKIRYCALFLVVSLLVLTFAFTMTADRYVYPILPFYYLMGAYMLVLLIQGLWSFAHSRVVLGRPDRGTSQVFGGYLTRPMRLLMMGTVGLVFAAVLITPMLPLSNYNLFVSRLVGFSYHRHYPDYDAVGQYMKQHMKEGDIVIAIAPPPSVLYYVGRVDYFFSLDRSLFLIEKDGAAVEKPTGAQALLNQDDFQAVLSKYKRIWIISDNGNYQAAVRQRFTFPPDFRLVFEGYGSAIYCRGG